MEAPDRRAQYMLEATAYVFNLDPQYITSRMRYPIWDRARLVMYWVARQKVGIAPRHCTVVFQRCSTTIASGVRTVSRWDPCHPGYPQIQEVYSTYLRLTGLREGLIHDRPR